MTTGPADIASSLISAQQDLLTQRAGYAVIKAQNQAEQQLIAMIDKSLESSAPPAPAPGTGLVVDRQA